MAYPSQSYEILKKCLISARRRGLKKNKIGSSDGRARVGLGQDLTRKAKKKTKKLGMRSLKVF